MGTHQRWSPVWCRGAHSWSGVKIAAFPSSPVQLVLCGVAVLLHRTLIHRKEQGSNNNYLKQAMQISCPTAVFEPKVCGLSYYMPLPLGFRAGSVIKRKNSYQQTSKTIYHAFPN